MKHFNLFVTVLIYSLVSCLAYAGGNMQTGGYHRNDNPSSLSQQQQGQQQQQGTSIIGNARYSFVMSHTVATPPSVVGGANITQTTGSCGPLQSIEREDVEGVFHGVLTDSTVDLGKRERLVPYKDANGNQVLFDKVEQNGVTYLMGHEVVILSTVLTTGGARQLGLGANGSNSGGASGSAGSSGATQQQSEHIQLRNCVYQAIVPVQDAPVVSKVESEPVVAPATVIPKKQPLIKRNKRKSVCS